MVAKALDTQLAPTSLEFTPTWVVAAVCAVIVGISFSAERGLHHAGQYLKRSHQKPLYEALQKVKEELMLLGFISLLMTAAQSGLIKICVPRHVVDFLLPCKAPPDWSSPTTRRLLQEEEVNETGYCNAEHKVQLVSLEALHQLHIFIFVLAIVHVNFSVLTVVFGGLKIHLWKKWEDAIEKEVLESEQVQKPKITQVLQHDFIKSRFLGMETHWTILANVKCFFKQFHGSVTKSDYAALRLGFIMTHCRRNPKFNFHKYMVRALEDDFKIVVGISWYLWIFVVFFLFLNINGWHTYFWIASLPLFLLLAVGTKLELIMSKLARDIAEKHTTIEGDLVVTPDDGHFWFRRPHLVLLLIHFILFQNAFEIGFFFWIWVQYGFKSCIMGQLRFIVPRLIFGALIQLVASYSTLPLYCLVTQMGSNYKKAVFDESVQAGLLGWAQKVKKKNALKDVVAAAKAKQDKLKSGWTVGELKPITPKQPTPQAEPNESTPLAEPNEPTQQAHPNEPTPRYDQEPQSQDVYIPVIPQGPHISNRF